MMQTRSLLDMQEFIRRLIVQIIFQVLLYHLILTGLLFNSFFQDGQEDYMHECIGMEEAYLMEMDGMVYY